ncbi:MAG: hypothetical protein ACE15C_15830 [Phycisphaerae bacterium]
MRRLVAVAASLSAVVLCVTAVWSESPRRAASQPASGPATASAPASQAASAPAGAAKIKELIANLASEDGRKRTAATADLFSLGNAALEPLKQAGAFQLTPQAQSRQIEARRMDLVYSLLDGLRQDPVKGFRTDAILLRVENDCTVDDVADMGKRLGFTLKRGATVTDGWIAALPADAAKFSELLKALLTNERKVIEVHLLYFSKIPTP